MGGLVFFKKAFDFSINPDQPFRRPHILTGRFNTAIAHRPGSPRVTSMTPYPNRARPGSIPITIMRAGAPDQI